MEVNLIQTNKKEHLDIFNYFGTHQILKMEKFETIKNSVYCQADIPMTAKAIKITNIQSPYIMKAYETTKYSENIDRIYRKLLKAVDNSSIFKKKKNSTEHFKIGDVVLVESSDHRIGVPELPSYICRGVITYIRKEDTKYNIFLVDHGISVKLNEDEFYVIPKDFISDKYLTKTVSIFNILPIRMKMDVLNRCDPKMIIVEEWSEEAIQFTKNLLIESKVVYFDHLYTDEETEKKYGEFYLVIEDIVMPLSKALIINRYAIEEKDSSQSVINQNDVQESVKENIVKSVKQAINSESKAIQFTSKHNITKNSERVLIQSAINCEVLSDVSDLCFPKEIHKGWTEYIKSSRPKKLQAYIWPAIKRGLNVIAIGSPQCGKTTGCTIAACGLVAMHQNELLCNRTHPLALILCSSSFEVINVQSLCVAFLQAFGNIKSVAAFNGRTHRSVAASIYSGCQILVTTPRYLIRFLNENKDLLSFDKLLCLVFDNADLILSKYYKSVGELFKKHRIINNREPQGDNRPILQMIISATNWTNDIRKFVSVMYNPYICIASFIEAVVFKNVHPKVYILKSVYKNQKILDILKDDYTTLKTMIVCTNAEEAEKLNTFLLSTKKTLLIHEKMRSFDIQALQENWKICIYGSYPVLICTDAILSQLDFINIQWLIHHSVLLAFKNQFNYRFSVLLDNLIQNSTKCRISIFIDENNNVQFPSIVRIMQRMNVVISPDLLKNIERIAITLERNKKNYDLCDNVKLLGFCSEQNSCVFRHCILPDIDTPMMDIQMNDKVKLLVMYIHDTTHFSARIIGHIPHSNNPKKITFSSVEYMQVALNMQEYYQNIENRKMCTSTNVGDVCVLQESIDTFKRVQIKRIRYDKVTSEDVKFVDLRCIDSGIIYKCVDVRKLMHIPEELLNLPTHTVEIFLSGLAPCDDEYVWNHYVNQTVHKWFEDNFDKRSYIIGKVRLHLGNTIWLDDLEIGTKLINHNDLIGSSLKKELITQKNAVLNEDHVSLLIKLCKQSGMVKLNGYDINTL